MSHVPKIAFVLLAASQLAACKHLYAGGDAGRLHAAPAAGAQPLNRS
jgi:hypothetical protein